MADVTNVDMMTDIGCVLVSRANTIALEEPVL